ncbi:DMT family transporter [Domibacillus robiginosus]|uniref:DMT family transporter n=1 Tax=Domibacillus robiginosus TaxID=1071054 RepID=UPI000A7EA62E|nr:SMR family transporter [Domibacillus robiginosus]
MKKEWIYVMLTCLMELLWLMGFNIAFAWWHWLLIAGVISIDFYFLSKACENLPAGTVYAIFAGIGTLGTALMDYVLFKGEIDAAKIFFMLILVAGVIGLKLSDQHPEAKQGGRT